MHQFWFYVVISSMTIASPGPGILLTLTNTINYNLRQAMAGIFGISAGMGIISFIAASSVGVIITSFQPAFSSVKTIGAIYLIYLGVKLFRSTPRSFVKNTNLTLTTSHSGKLFQQGLFVSLLNPKPIVFFMAVFPQFIDSKNEFLPQLMILSVTFCTLVIIIHSFYSFFAHSMKLKMSSGRMFRILNKTGGVVLVCFATGLLISVLNS
jgi:threonine/homoserine/homoserine lactone efflux protein